MAAPQVIGIAGWAGAGKDTVGGYISLAFGHSRLAFADAVKDHVARSFALNRRDMDDPRYKENHRGLLIQQANWFRSRRADHWIRKSGLRERAQGGQKLVVTDVRFRNEVEAVRSLGGVTLWVDDPALSTPEHESVETGPEDGDFTVQNPKGPSPDLYLSLLALHHAWEVPVCNPVLTRYCLNAAKGKRGNWKPVRTYDPPPYLKYMLWVKYWGE